MRQIKENKNVSPSIYGKVPAQDREAEKAILGVMLIERDAADKVLPILSIDDFYVDAHMRIYNAAVKIHISGAIIDMVTIVDQLNKTGELEIIGGAYYLAGLTNAVISSANIVIWARIVKEHSIKRAISVMAGELHEDSYNTNVDALELLSRMMLKISKVQDSFTSQQVTRISEIAMSVVMEMEEAANNDDPFLGIPCGLDSIDKVTLGFSAPDFIVLAAGPGEGKSTMMLQWALNMGIAGHAIGLFSLEMKNRQLMWKIFSSLIEEDIKTIRKGDLTPEKWHLLHTAINDKLMNANIFLQDKGGMSVIELCSVVRTLVAKHGIKGICIDYLQLLTAGTERGWGTRESEVNFISKQLKQLAMELNIFVIALSQMSRMEKGTPRMYKISDLRESGAIEQDADGVMFIWRPAYHNVQTLKAGDTPFADNDVLFYTAKWRLGDTGTVPLKFNGKYSRFEDKKDDFGMFKPIAPPSFVPDPNAWIEPKNQFQKPYDNEYLPF